MAPKKRRKMTQPGFEPVTETVSVLYVYVDDPVCNLGRPGPCRGCHYCLRARFGAEYYLKGQA